MAGVHQRVGPARARSRSSRGAAATAASKLDREALALARAASAAAQIEAWPGSQAGCRRSCASQPGDRVLDPAFGELGGGAAEQDRAVVRRERERALEQVDRRQPRLHRRSGRGCGRSAASSGASAAAFSNAATAGARSSSLRLARPSTCHMRGIAGMAPRAPASSERQRLGLEPARSTAMPRPRRPHRHRRDWRRGSSAALVGAGHRPSIALGRVGRRHHRRHRRRARPATGRDARCRRSG